MTTLFRKIHRILRSFGLISGFLIVQAIPTDASPVSNPVYSFEAAPSTLLEKMGNDLQIQTATATGPKTVKSVVPWPAESGHLMQIHLLDDRDLERILLPRFLRQSGILSQPIPLQVFDPMNAGDYKVEIQVQSGSVSAQLPDCSLSAGEIDLPSLCPNRVETQWKKDNWVLLGVTLPSLTVKSKMKLRAHSDKWYLPTYENEFEVNVFGAKLHTEVQWSTNGTGLESVQTQVPVSKIDRVQINDLGLLRTIYNLILRGKLCGTARCPEAEVWVQGMLEKRLAEWIQSDSFSQVIKQSSAGKLAPMIEKFLDFSQLGLAGKISSLHFETKQTSQKLMDYFGRFGSDLNWTALNPTQCVDVQKLGKLPSQDLKDGFQEAGETKQSWVGDVSDPNRIADFILGRKLLQQGLESATQTGILCGSNSFKFGPVRGEIKYRPVGFPSWTFQDGVGIRLTMESDFALLNKKEKKWIQLNGVQMTLRVNFEPLIDTVKGQAHLFLKIKNAKVESMKFPKGFKGTLAKLLLKPTIKKEVNRYLTSSPEPVQLFPKSFEIFTGPGVEKSELELVSMGWVPGTGLSVGFKANHR
ncbi:MAG: hypothetical protein JNL01_13360 [Bdellovibrionales bacterium]|nr:hypothetical protein [Bdellovibrionales bacterium]